MSRSRYLDADPVVLDLRWIQVRRPWSETNRRAYDKGYNALVYAPVGGAGPVTVDFVRDLSGLRALHLAGEIVDDSAAFASPGLCYLILEDENARNAVDFASLAGSLRFLETTWRRGGVESLRHAADLEELTIDNLNDLAANRRSNIGLTPRQVSRERMARGMRPFTWK